MQKLRWNTRPANSLITVPPGVGRKLQHPLKQNAPLPPGRGAFLFAPSVRTSSQPTKPPSSIASMERDARYPQHEGNLANARTSTSAVIQSIESSSGCVPDR